MMNPPCLNCEERHYICWSECGKYAAFRTEVDKAMKHLRKDDEADSFRTDGWEKGKTKRWKAGKK